MGAKKLCALYAEGTKNGEYSSREIADLLRTRRVTVSNYANTGILYKGRYLSEVVCEGAEAREDPLFKEWDEVRKQILTAGR